MGRLALLLAAFLGFLSTARAEPLRIAVISDLNGSYGSTEYDDAVSSAVERIIALRPDLVISTGDMVAGQRGNPKLTAAELGEMWTAFHRVVSDPLTQAGLPLLVTPGNHDASAYAGFEAERAAFAAAWSDRVPDVTQIDGGDWPFRGAWSLRGVLLIGMDATRSGPLAAGDMARLRRTLAAEAGKHRSVVLFGHLPMMPITKGREDDVLADPALFDLAQEFGIDLWLSGHHHGYYSGTAGGMLFVAQGALGSGPRRLLGADEVSLQTFTWIEIEEDGGIRATALAAPGFSALAVETLPATLGSGTYKLTRQDVRD